MSRTIILGVTILSLLRELSHPKRDIISGLASRETSCCGQGQRRQVGMTQALVFETSKFFLLTMTLALLDTILYS